MLMTRNSYDKGFKVELCDTKYSDWWSKEMGKRYIIFVNQTIIHKTDSDTEARKLFLGLTKCFDAVIEKVSDFVAENCSEKKVKIPY